MNLCTFIKRSIVFNIKKLRVSKTNGRKTSQRQIIEKHVNDRNIFFFPCLNTLLEIILKIICITVKLQVFGHTNKKISIKYMYVYFSSIHNFC